MDFILLDEPLVFEDTFLDFESGLETLAGYGFEVLVEDGQLVSVVLELLLLRQLLALLEDLLVLLLLVFGIDDEVEEQGVSGSLHFLLQEPSRVVRDEKFFFKKVNIVRPTVDRQLELLFGLEVAPNHVVFLVQKSESETRFQALVRREKWVQGLHVLLHEVLFQASILQTAVVLGTFLPLLLALLLAE